MPWYNEQPSKWTSKDTFMLLFYSMIFFIMFFLATVGK